MVTTRTGSGPGENSDPDPELGAADSPAHSSLHEQVAALTQLVTSMMVRDDGRRGDPSPEIQTAQALTQMTQAATALTRVVRDTQTTADGVGDDLFDPLESPEESFEEIAVANPRFAPLFCLDNYRLNNRRRTVTAKQVSGLTKRAQEMRPRFTCSFDGRGTLELFPFLARLQSVANEAGLSEGMVLRVLPDYLLSQQSQPLEVLNWYPIPQPSNGC